MQVGRHFILLATVVVLLLGGCASGGKSAVSGAQPQPKDAGVSSRTASSSRPATATHDDSTPPLSSATPQDEEAAYSVVSEVLDSSQRITGATAPAMLNRKVPSVWWETHDSAPYKYVSVTVASRDDQVVGGGGWYDVVQESPGSPWIIVDSGGPF